MAEAVLPEAIGFDLIFTTGLLPEQGAISGLPGAAGLALQPVVH